jgi:hypothetical protein
MQCCGKRVILNLQYWSPVQSLWSFHFLFNSYQFYLCLKYFNNLIVIFFNLNTHNHLVLIEAKHLAQSLKLVFATLVSIQLSTTNGILSILDVYGWIFCKIYDCDEFVYKASGHRQLCNKKELKGILDWPKDRQCQF